MRAPTLTNYVNATYRLGNLTSSLQQANEVASTQKRINEISDDPLGSSQVLSLKDSIGNLEQIEQNVLMGISWLEGEESSLSSVNDLILEAKTESLRLVNASATGVERENAVQRINDIIEQIVSLGNLQINGNYVFSGTDTNIIPLEFDQTEPEQVIYHGNETQFQIRTDKNSGVKVGRDGRETFWDDNIDINSTNNTIVFREDNGHGSTSEKMLTAVIPDGLYTVETLETALKNAVNDTSANHGYGATYLVSYNSVENKYDIREDGSFEGYLKTEFMWESGGEAHVKDVAASASILPEDVNVTVVNQDALTIGTPEPHGTEPFRLTWQGASGWEVDNNPGYVFSSSSVSGTSDYISVDLDGNGAPDIEINLATPATTQGQFIEFEIVARKGDHSIGHEIGFNAENTIYAPPTSDNQAALVTDLIITAGTNDKIDFLEFHRDNPYEHPTKLEASVKAKTYTSHAELAREVEKALEAESRANGNGINYTVSWDDYTQKFTIKENGSTLDKFQLQWNSGKNAPAEFGGTGQSIGSLLGFDASSDDIHESSTGNREVSWGIFDTLIDLKHYLSQNDVDGIERAVGRLENNFDNMTSTIVDIGMKYSRLEVRQTITSEVSLSLTERRSSIEDADAVEAIMKLQNLQNAYQAALGSTSMILNMSLVDYLT